MLRTILCMVAVVSLSSSTGCDGVNQTAGPPAVETITRVEVVRPLRKDIRHTVTQPATVHPYYQADIVAKVAGYFEAVYVDIGGIPFRHGDAHPKPMLLINMKQRPLGFATADAP